MNNILTQKELIQRGCHRYGMTSQKEDRGPRYCDNCFAPTSLIMVAAGWNVDAWDLTNLNLQEGEDRN